MGKLSAIKVQLELELHRVQTSTETGDLSKNLRVFFSERSIHYLWKYHEHIQIYRQTNKPKHITWWILLPKIIVMKRWTDLK